MSNVTDLKLTDNQSLTLTYLAAATQEGLYTAEDGTVGVWFDTLNADLVGTIATKAQAKASLNQLVKKGIFEADTTVEEGSTWLTLTDLGEEALTAFGEDAPAEEADDEDLLGLNLVAGPDPVISESAALQQDIRATHTVPAPEEDDEDLLGDITADVEPGTPLDEIGDALAELYAQESEGDIDTVSTEQVVTHTENYTVNEWKDADGTEWTETVFADGSRTLKRRRLVSESWRTDYWGAEFSGDKEKATTSKLAKAARAMGHFTHVLHEAPAA